MTPQLDPASVAGKAPVASQHVALIVVGAGPAGLAAAIAAARAGVATMLVDEHPVSAALMGLDVPLHWGQRMTGAVRNKARLVEQLVETNPGLGEAFELGIDVQLGVHAWGAYRNGPGVRSLDRPLLGLADEDRAWLVSFDRLVVAAGARDLAIGFPGWEKPGVMGVQAATSLLQRYDAFAGRRLLVLGSGPLGLEFAAASLKRGCTIAGIVEIESDIVGPDRLRELPAGHGVPFYCRHVIKEARGLSEVDAAVLIRLDDTGRPIAGTEISIDCDTIVTAIGAVPNIELLDPLGCRIEFQAERGGYVPAVDAGGLTSVASIHAVGDCAGLGGDAAADGARVGAAVAASLSGRPAAVTDAAPPAPDQGIERAAAWLRVQIAASGLDVIACQCEEVTRREIVELRPPRYLGADANAPPTHDLRALAADGPVNQDQVKRLTRAGMGPCQGRRCREQVQALIADAAGTPLAAVPLARYRPPVRPLPLSLLAAGEESEALSANWVAWFNISTQWLPHWQVLPVPLPEPGAAAAIVPSGK